MFFKAKRSGKRGLIYIIISFSFFFNHSVRFKNYLGERINVFSFVLILYFIIFASHKESEIKNIITRNTIWQ